MAGHSKWANIKHKKAAVDAKRGKIFTKIIRELVVAAKAGPNPEDNPRLRGVVDKALAANMKKDTIEKAIARGAGNAEGDNYEEQASASLAKNLKGKLLLTHGDRDANVHIAHTLQLVDQLIKHNKNFDLLILPNRQHCYLDEPYFIRRLWDYFVEHLLNEKPPVDYCIELPRH